MKKRLLGLALALVMIISLLPATALAANTKTRSIILMDGFTDGVTDYKLPLDGTDGTVYYTKNKAVTLKDTEGNEFDGWVQELTQVTNEETDEWNLKFYAENDVLNVVLKGAKLDAYNDATKLTTGSTCNALKCSGTSSYINLTVKETSYLDSRIALNGYGSSRWYLTINVEEGAKLCSKTTSSGIYLQRPLILNGDFEFEGTDIGYFVYTSDSGTGNNKLTINSGNIKVSGYAGLVRGNDKNLFTTVINGGTVTLNAAKAFGHVNFKYDEDNPTAPPTITVQYSKPQYKEGMCVKYTDLNGNPLEYATTYVDGAIFVAKEAHAIADCSVGGTCPDCGVTVAAKECVKAEDDGDCTTAVNCTVCGKEAVPAKAEHTAGTIADCTKPAMCTNEGCTKEAAPAARTEHEAGQDDGDCTTGIKCKHCEEIATPGAEKHTVTNRTDCGVAYNCEVCGKEAFAAGEHTPAADDGDCTTAVKCSVCGKETTAAQDAHKYTDKNDTTCDNAGCTNTRKVEGTENPKTGDNSAIAVVAALMVTAAAAFVTTKKFAR